MSDELTPKSLFHHALSQGDRLARPHGVMLSSLYSSQKRLKHFCYWQPAAAPDAWRFPAQAARPELRRSSTPTANPCPATSPRRRAASPPAALQAAFRETLHAHVPRLAVDAVCAARFRHVPTASRQAVPNEFPPSSTGTVSFESILDVLPICLDHTPTAPPTVDGSRAMVRMPLMLDAALLIQPQFR